ncbi:DUF4214 domain-containing protein [Telmatocola sphagniphila]|uniref:DUF4214 domain-containing protein n=1 Tax=Telmatocola sphagniphila TaxID=1123043 RepID=A0A8E6ETJ0_9BACT|nr:DUF4214 domain-containing protein [Telmatocola sphagniphila]QVL30160.1 DUF4214 domain-containing protein [Telmatocola sphagniphila]
MFSSIRRKANKNSSPKNLGTKLHLTALEDRTALSIYLPTPGTPSNVYLLGTPGNDSFIVRISPTSATQIQFSDNGGSTFSTANLSDVTAIYVQDTTNLPTGVTASQVQNGGDDTLTIDNSNGVVGKSTALPIYYTGGQGKNQLNLIGNPKVTLSETYNQTAGSTSGGTITATGSSSSFTVNFNTISLIQDSLTASSFTFNPISGNNVVSVQNGDLINGNNSLKLTGIDYQGITDPLFLLNHFNSNTNSGLASSSFVPVDLLNKTAVTVTTGAGNSTFLLNETGSVAGLSTLTLNGGTGTNTLDKGSFTSTVNVSTNNMATVNAYSSADWFIQRLYMNDLKRVASQAEIANWQAALTAIGQAGVTNAIDNSQEAQMREVNAWYQAFLGRAADPSGLANGLTSLSKMTSEQYIASIIASPEFYSLQNTNSSMTADQNFIQGLYENVLNRSADAAGLNTWTTLMSTYSRTQIAQLFLTSLEFRTSTINSMYSALLLRQADQGGLTSWLGNKLDTASMRRAFLSSTEYLNPGLTSATSEQLYTNGGAIGIAGSSSSPDNVQYYSFQMPNSGLLTLTLSSTANTGSGTLVLTDAYGNPINSISSTSGTGNSNNLVVGGRTYYVAVSSASTTAFSFNFTANLAN